jgi:hypothetical protein
MIMMRKMTAAMIAVTMMREDDDANDSDMT